MIKKLLVVFASAAALALLSISAAFVVGGSDFRGAIADGDFHWGEEYDGPMATREFAFDTGKVLTIDAPVNLRFERSETVSMKVEGPKDAMKDLVYENGELSLKGSHRHLRHGLTVTVTAPTLAGLVLDAPGDVELVELQQDAIEIRSSGAADIDASGTVRKLTLEADGAADLDFREVKAKDASVQINGAGDVDISATGAVDIEINGAGSVTLHAKPASVTSQINGVGSVDRAY